MTTQQPINRRQQAVPSKMMRVAPNVTDPSMQSNKSQADTMLAEMGENPDSVDEVVFNRKKPTKEELEHQTSTSATSDNTMLIIIFALIVIALVAIIVWMIMKQGSDKKEEEEVRRMIQPHPRNGMPSMNRYPVNQQQYNNLQQQRMNQQRMQHTQQTRQQQPQQEEDEEPEVVDDEEVQPKTQQKTQPPAKSNKSVKSVSNSSGIVASISAEEKELSDKAEADVEKPSNFTKENPHPDIIKPGEKTKATDIDVDDVMKRTEALLNAKPASKSTEPSNSMNDADRALLDRIANQNNDDDEDDEEDDE